MIGVSDAGEIIGVSDHNRLKSEVQAIARTTDPPIALEIESLGNVLAVTVPMQKNKPYSFGGKFFIREGASSQQMSRAEIRELFYEEGLIHFDEMPCPRFSLEKDLLDDNWQRFRSRAKIPADMDAQTALENLHLLKDGQMSNAGAWLLAQDIRKFNISADVACALFLGTDKVHILDRRSFHADVYSIISDTVSYILTKINVAYIIRHVKREERPELPEEALREAVVNAVAHRSYRSTANVQVYIFKDRVEIVSPGGLPAGMTEADLGSKSIPRNPLLFAILHRMNAVEHIGSGIKRIRSLCREYGVEEAKIEVSENWFTIIFPRPEVPESNHLDNASIVAEGSHSDLFKASSGTKSGLSRDQVAIMFQCLSEQPITELMTLLERKNRSKFRSQLLTPLLENELLAMTVPDKPQSSKQKYRLTDKGRKMLNNLNLQP